MRLGLRDARGEGDRTFEVSHETYRHLPKVPEGFIGFDEELPGANTQGATLDEVRNNLNEAVELVLEANRVLSEESIQGQQVIRESLFVSGE
jgi:predicted RNase H-like HicB family nuclease